MRPPIGNRGENLSIMIPTYNCASYLRQTLLSLQAQIESITEAYIEVVDDCSNDNPELIVKEVWGDRVKFHRNLTNQGPCGNFNSCLERATTTWVQILHGDDLVLPGFFSEANLVSLDFPECHAVFSPVLVIDEYGVWKSVTQPLGQKPRDMLVYDPYQWLNCPVQFSGNIFTKEIIERSGGGFDSSFIHVNDWNLWWRMAKTGLVAYSSRCGGVYRIFRGNHTSSLMKTAKNVDEGLEQLDRLKKSLSRTEYSNIIHSDLYKPLFISLMLQSQGFANDPIAFRANMSRVFRFPVASWSFFLMMKTLLKSLKGN